MVVWHPCSLDDWLETHLNNLTNGNNVVMLEKHYLGDEEEPMDLFIYGDEKTRQRMLRSAHTINSDLYWRTYD